MLKTQSYRKILKPDDLAGQVDGFSPRIPGVPALSEIEKSFMKAFSVDEDPNRERNGEKLFDNKLELGISILQHVESQLNRADAKAQFTLTLDAIFIASSAFFGAGTGNELVNGTDMLRNRIVLYFGAAMFVTLLVSTVYAILAVVPRLTSAKRGNGNVFYFGNIVRHQREKFVDYYWEQSNHEIEKMLMSEIYDLAGIAKQKFGLVRISYIFLFMALGFWSLVQFLISSI